MSVFTVYSYLRNRFMSILVLIFVSLVVFVNAIATQVDYPAAFKALTQVQDPVEITHAGVTRYMQLVNDLPNEAWRERAEALYAEDLHYSDTFILTNTRDDIISHLAELRETQTHFAVTPYDLVEGEQGVYIVWSIENKFSLLGQDINAASIGVTLFRFNDAGKIVFQQDFWDSTEGFYQHIPVLGTALRSIRDQVAGA